MCWLTESILYNLLPAFFLFFFFLITDSQAVVLLENDSVILESRVLPARSNFPRWGWGGRKRTAHLQSGYNRPWCSSSVASGLRSCSCCKRRFSYLLFKSLSLPSTSLFSFYVLPFLSSPRLLLRPAPWKLSNEQRLVCWLLLPLSRGRLPPKIQSGMLSSKMVPKVGSADRLKVSTPGQECPQHIVYITFFSLPNSMAGCEKDTTMCHILIVGYTEPLCCFCS